MKHPALALLVLSLLTACPTSTSGNGLCAYARIANQCGIPDDECQELARAHPDFIANATYTAESDVDADGACVLSASPLGDGGWFGPRPVAFEVELGEVRDGGSFFDGDGDGLNADEERAAGTDVDNDDSDDDGDGDGDEVDCDADPLDAASSCE